MVCLSLDKKGKYAQLGPRGDSPGSRGRSKHPPAAGENTTQGEQHQLRRGEKKGESKANATTSLWGREAALQPSTTGMEPQLQLHPWALTPPSIPKFCFTPTDSEAQCSLDPTERGPHERAKNKGAREQKSSTPGTLRDIAMSRIFQSTPGGTRCARTGRVLQDPAPHSQPSPQCPTAARSAA